MTLFIDMDEVIADAYGAHIELYNRDFGASLSLADCYGKEVWQCVPEEHQQSVKMHASRLGFFRDLRPIEGSQEVLRELMDRYELYIASAAMQYPDSLKEKSDWLDKFFPFIPWRNRILCGGQTYPERGYTYRRPQLQPAKFQWQVPIGSLLPIMYIQTGTKD